VVGDLETAEPEAPPLLAFSLVAGGDFCGLLLVDGVLADALPFEPAVAVEVDSVYGAGIGGPEALCWALVPAAAAAAVAAAMAAACCWRATLWGWALARSMAEAAPPGAPVAPV